jgi:hypothetical protein
MLVSNFRKYLNNASSMYIQFWEQIINALELGDHDLQLCSLMQNLEPAKILNIQLRIIVVLFDSWKVKHSYCKSWCTYDNLDQRVTRYISGASFMDRGSLLVCSRALMKLTWSLQNSYTFMVFAKWGAWDSLAHVSHVNSVYWF